MLGIALFLNTNFNKSSPYERQKEGKIMKHTFDFGRDYFSANMGYVLDGMHFRSISQAMEYLTKEAYMEQDEAESYLSRLTRSFSRRNIAAM